MHLNGAIFISLFCFASLVNLSTESVGPCPLSMRPCSNGVCLPAKWFCDGDPDCPSGEDETNCGGGNPPPQPNPWAPSPTVDPWPNPTTAPADPWTPRRSFDPWPNPTPAPADPWTPRRSFDPWPNPTPAPADPWTPGPTFDPASRQPICPPGTFLCDFQCVSLTLRCNGIQDCSDGTDELNCQTPGTGVTGNCGPDEVQCFTGPCIKTFQICDGKADCSHYEDEYACPFVVNKKYTYKCIESCVGITRPNCTTTTAAPTYPTTTTTTTTTKRPVPYCTQGYTYVYDRCIKVFVFPPKDWIWAKNECQKDSAILVEIDNGDFFLRLHRYLNQSLYDSYSYWTGATDAQSEGHWIWTNTSRPVHRGAPLWTLTEEGSNYVQQPNGGIIENCGLLEDCPFQYLNDKRCSKEYPYICQRQAQFRYGY